MELILKDLPLLIGQKDPITVIVSKLLQNPNDLDSLAALTRYLNIKVWFKQPTKIHTSYHKIHEKISHICPKLFLTEGTLYYCVRTNTRYGYPLDINGIEKIEPLINTLIEFKGYEEFRKQFDTYFITEKEIQKLWNEKSSQHGHKYNKKDFRTIGKRGHEVMTQFLTRFKGINNTDYNTYEDSQHGDYKVLTKRYITWHHSGRDISIEHTSRIGYVFYNSEFHRCGNGRYGLVANKNKYLWLEDD